MENNYDLINNKISKQYEFHIDRYVPLIEYIVNEEGKVYLTHTEVPRAIGGKGIGTQLVVQTLRDIETHGQKVVPLCPFVAGYIKKNPEWRRIVAPGINIR